MKDEDIVVAPRALHLVILVERTVGVSACQEDTVTIV